MSEQNERGGIRRVSRRDRKRRLDSRGPLFPIEESVEAEPPAPEPAAPDVEHPEPAPVIEKAERAKTVSPPEERFPPLVPYIEEQPAALPPAPTLKRRSTLLPNLISVFFFLATLAALALFALIVVNPYTSLNPFPPFTPVPIVITATPGPGIQFPSVDTSVTPTFTPLPASAVQFALNSSGVVYAPNGNGQECNWSSIAGSVTDAKGGALDGYRILITDVKGDEKTVFSGSAQTFGPGGFELFLNGTPLEAQYSVQLLTQQGAPASEPYTVTTRADCQSNVAILTFVQKAAS
jgi:hypothetical protein